MRIRKPILFLMGLYSFWGLNLYDSAADDTNKPNFLFIQADQFRYDLLQSVQEEMTRYDGKTHVRTPNLDRLRREGVIFRRAYSQCAVCAPARSTFRTGCTLERHGGQSNGLASKSTYDLDAQFKTKIEAAVTFEQILVEKRGYVAEHYGKWHMPEIFNWSTNGSTRVMRYNDFNFVSNTPLFNNSESSLDYDAKLATVAGGLSTVESPGMQENTYSRYPYVTAAIDTRYGLAPYSTLTVSQPDQQGRDTLPANRTPSYFEGTAAVAALDRLATNTAPFVLTASFHNPHAPMVATGLYYDYYRTQQANMFIPPNLSGADTTNSAWKKHSDPDYQDSGKVKEWMVCYYALCEEVDHYVGLLLNKLDEKGIASNTFVIFVSDHGEMLGAHGMREKNVFLEESAHVPMLMRFPGRIKPGTTVEETVATLDCFATILDYLGAAPYDQSDGRSLRRFVEKQNYNRDFDDEAIVTEWDFRDPDGSGGLTRTLGGESNFLCKKGPWKLILTKLASSSRLDMLYNIETDPYEVNNYVGNNGMTASDAAIGKAEHLKRLLIEWMQRMDGPNHVYSDPVYNAGQGMGDIAEITARRKWKALNIWVSDTAVKMGLPVNVSGQWTRNEYLYLGRTTAGTLNVTNITIQGADAGLFQASEFVSGSIPSGGYKRVKLTYRPSYYGQPVGDARVMIRHSAGADKVVELSASTSNSPPVINSTPIQKANVGSTYSYTMVASDPEDDPVSYSSIALPGWLNFDAGTAVLSGVPSAADVGEHPVVLRVRDAYGSTDQSFTVLVGVTKAGVPYAGAATPFRTLEAEAGVLAGGAAILSMAGLPSAPTVQLESSGRECVELDGTGESISWADVDACNAFVIRASIPDAPGGGGITNTLNLYVNGTFRQAITITSGYSWVYGDGFTDNNPAAGTPKRFYDMHRTFISGVAVPSGSTIMLRKDAANTADYYRIDLIQLENVAPPLPQPPNTLSVLTYGATPDDETDDSTAFKACITVCQNQGKGMWIPAGSFRTQGIISARGINIYGAGMWHTTNQRIISTNVSNYRHKWDLADCSIQDLYIENPEVARTPEGGHDYGMTLQGANGWMVQRVWVHRGGASFWCSGTGGIIKDCRATESWADGINLNNGPNVVAEKRGFNLTCTNNYIIGSGDDGIAINAQNGGGTDWNMVAAKVQNNTSIAVNWANGIRVAGGRSSLIESNLITDPTDCNGIRVGKFGIDGNPCESVLVLGNVILRGCGIRTLYGHGGITVSDDAAATVVSNTIIDSPGIGIDVQSCNATFTGNVISSPQTNGFLIKPGVTGTGVFAYNQVVNMNVGQSAFRNDSPATFIATLANNSWQSLAEGQPVIASSFQTGNVIANGNDGNATTRWAASNSSLPQWWQVDLGAIRNVTNVTVNWYNSSSRAYGYQIAVSSNNTDFSIVVDKSSNTVFGNTSDVFSALARYIRITVTACTQANGFASFYECDVFGSSSPAIALDSPIITVALLGTALRLSWPTDHLGWRVQVQTNALFSGLSANWVTLPGTDLMTSTNITVDSTIGAVLYRMVYP